MNLLSLFNKLARGLGPHVSCSGVLRLVESHPYYESSDSVARNLEYFRLTHRFRTMPRKIKRRSKSTSVFDEVQLAHGQDIGYRGYPSRLAIWMSPFVTAIIYMVLLCSCHLFSCGLFYNIYLLMTIHIKLLDYIMYCRKTNLNREQYSACRTRHGNENSKVSSVTD